MELGIVSEALQLATKELARQNERLVSMQNKVEAEQKRYKSLLELMPNGYLVTDVEYAIREVNQAATDLFDVEPQSLIGKSLIKLVHNDDRALFQAKLSQLAQRSQIEFSVRLQRNHASFFNASLLVSSVREPETASPTVRWLLQDITERKRAEVALESSNYDVLYDRTLHSFSKGEIIPLEPQQIWLVTQGAVKLTTMSDRGEEMLIGLIRDSMIFGPSLTALQIYQAIALSKVQLISIPLTELAHLPHLSQALLP